MRCKLSIFQRSAMQALSYFDIWISNSKFLFAQHEIKSSNCKRMNKGDKLSWKKHRFSFILKYSFNIVPFQIQPLWGYRAWQESDTETGMWHPIVHWDTVIAAWQCIVQCDTVIAAWQCSVTASYTRMERDMTNVSLSGVGLGN